MYHETGGSWVKSTSIGIWFITMVIQVKAVGKAARQEYIGNVFSVPFDIGPWK